MDVLAMSAPNDKDFDNLKIYPQPAASDSGIIVLHDVPAGSILKVYSISGVITGDTTRDDNSDAVIEWNIPQSIKQGIYLYSITGHGKKKSGKIAIIV